MTMLDINLNDVVEKPHLPANKPLTLAFKSASVEMAKNPNKTTGKIEPYVKCELSVLDPDWQGYNIYHNWSLSPGALSSPEPAFSIRKFFLVTEKPWGVDGRFSTEDLMVIQFVGTVKYKEGDTRPQLDKIMKAI